MKSKREKDGDSVAGRGAEIPPPLVFRGARLVPHPGRSASRFTPNAGCSFAASLEEPRRELEGDARWKNAAAAGKARGNSSKHPDDGLCASRCTKQRNCGKLPSWISEPRFTRPAVPMLVYLFPPISPARSSRYARNPLVFLVRHSTGLRAGANICEEEDKRGDYGGSRSKEWELSAGTILSGDIALVDVFMK
ncbi:hypothetical protein KM043_005658 [Ampulex compressa]|nr:hypothetical protein KM043_005658 [Ampulex compressa]